MVCYDRLPTEQPHPAHRALERLSLLALFRLMNREDHRAVRAVSHQLPRLARAAQLISTTLQKGGRLFFVGAGTSGRLGVIEAAECPPTFSTAPALVQAIIAGGRQAMFRSREGAEDDRARARAAIQSSVRPHDIVVGIAASGVTPFVAEAMRTAARKEARTILITGHPRSTIRADIRISLATGPELLRGSTRLKFGTATKLVLNMLTLGTMVQRGKTYSNLMVDVRPTSRKLKARALQIIRSITGCSERVAATSLRAAHGRVKTAILMVHDGLSYAAAIRRLSAAHGSLRQAIQRGEVAK